MEELRAVIDAAIREKGLLVDVETRLNQIVGRAPARAPPGEALTLKQLANRTGLSVSLISQIELGKSAASMSTLYKLATALQVQDDLLLRDGLRPDEADVGGRCAPCGARGARRYPSAAMRSVEEARPRPGLSVPVVTVLDAEGELVEADQRALVRYVLQDGYGADVVFAAGTTGEWDRVDNDVRQRVVQVCAEEVGEGQRARARSRGAARRGLGGRHRADARARRSRTSTSRSPAAPTPRCSRRSRSRASTTRCASWRATWRICSTRARDASRCISTTTPTSRSTRSVPHIRTRQVKAMSRLDFVRGIKVSASRKVLGNYTKAAAGFRERGEFGIYVGNAMLIFELFRPRSGWLGAIAEHWHR